MEAEDFVNELRKIALNIDIELLRSEGVSEGYIENLLKSYQVEKKTKFSGYENPLIGLIENYNVSNLQIGMISFSEKIEYNENYIFLGKVEQDNLAIDKISGTVVMLENGINHVINKCASTGAKFLDAINVAAAFLERRSIDDKIFENQELASQIAEECGELAGDKNYYQDFYKMLFGCDY